MSRKCDLSAIGPMSGNNVSHAKNRTRRRFIPNLRRASFRSEVLNEEYSFTVAAATLRTIEHRGGLDQHLLKSRPDTLSIAAQALRSRIARASTAAN